MFTRLLIDTTVLPSYVAEFLEGFLLNHGAYIITAERYVKLVQDEKALDYIRKGMEATPNIE